MAKFYHNRHQMVGKANTATVRRGGWSPPMGRVTEVCVYDGVLDHVETVVARCRNGGQQFEITNEEFVGRRFGTWADVERAVKEPWPEGAERVTRMTEALRDADLPKPRCIRRKPRFSEDTGDEFSLDRYRETRPYWRTTFREGSIGPSILTVAVQIGAPALRRSDELFWRGACAIALTELLEEAGYSVELWAYSYAQSVFNENNANAFQAVQVKGGSDRIDVHSLASATAGWYFRTMVFGGYYATPGVTPSFGLGFQSVLHRELLPYISSQPDKVMVVEECWSMDDATALAREYLRQVAEGPKAIGGHVEVG